MRGSAQAVQQRRAAAAAAKTTTCAHIDPPCSRAPCAPEHHLLPYLPSPQVPILVAFDCEEQRSHGLPPLDTKTACIFKVGDDIRQDVLAIQVTGVAQWGRKACSAQLLESTSQRAGLGLYACGDVMVTLYVTLRRE